jgi:hypothetical protein
MDEEESHGPWWSICESEFLRALHRVHKGEDPDEVYAEFYVNADHKFI